MKDANPPAPLPIVIGVAGHRDLRAEDVPQLEKRVRQILTALQKRYRATPLALMSRLRVGGERLVARIALELGFRLIVPLPMPRDEYVRDFPDAIVEFDDLLAKADKAFLLTQSEVAHANDAEGRVQCIAFAGAHIARHSQILLALWDGDIVVKVGGTSQMVHFKREGVETPYGPPRSPLDLVEGGPVYHLITPRQSNPAPAQPPFELVKLFPIEQSADERMAERAHQSVFQWMDQLNRDAAALGRCLAEERQQSKVQIFSDTEEEKLPRTARAALSWYSLVDALAIHFARRTLWALRILLVVAFLAALVFQIYAYMETKPESLLIAYVALAYGIGPLVYLWARFVGNYQNKYLDYRALAEGLRVQLFWRLAGLHTQAADHYLRKQRSEMDWIRQAMRVWTIPTRLEAETPLATTPNPDYLELVRERWVEREAKFFNARSNKDQTRANRFGLVGLALYVLGLILPLVKLVSPGEHPIIVAMSVCVVVAALVHLYSRTLGFAEHASQYMRMLQLYRKANQQLKELLAQGRLVEAQNIIRELGEEALIENGEWLLFHRSQPVQMPGLGKD
jgi:hypothetical protein